MFDEDVYKDMNLLVVRSLYSNTESSEAAKAELDHMVLDLASKLIRGIKETGILQKYEAKATMQDVETTTNLLDETCRLIELWKDVNE